MPHRKYCVDETFFDAIDSPVKAYILGFMISDANIPQHTRCFRWNLAARDRGHLNVIRQAMKSSHPIVEYTNNDGQDCASLVIHSTKMTRRLVDLGILPAKSLIAQPPRVPSEFFVDLWRGTVDGDGWVCKAPRGHYVTGLCGSKDVVSGYKDYIKNSLGIGDQVHAHHVGNIYVLHYQSINDVAAICKHLYANAPIALERKRLAAEKAMQQYTEVIDWNWLTTEYLEGLLAEHTSWRAVSRHLGISWSHLWIQKQRLGIEIAPITRQDITADMLVQAKKHLGSWRQAAASLGVKNNVSRILKNRGIKTGNTPGRDWSWLSSGILEELRRDLGSWKAVAKRLDINWTVLWKQRRRLGMPT